MSVSAQGTNQPMALGRYPTSDTLRCHTTMRPPSRGLRPCSGGGFIVSGTGPQAQVEVVVAFIALGDFIIGVHSHR